jgi:hypothetical protein
MLLGVFDILLHSMSKVKTCNEFNLQQLCIPTSWEKCLLLLQAKDLKFPS